MEIRSAKISNQTPNTMNPGNSIGVFQGQKGICCLSSGINMPKDAQGIPEKVTNLVVDSYMKRPALSNEAADGIYKRANDSVLVTQSPQYPSFVSTSAVFFLKNKYMYTCAGDSVIYHFINGVFKEAFTSDINSSLGNLQYSSPKISEAKTFDKGQNTFLICSRKFAETFSEAQLEDALIRATHTTQKGKKPVSEVKCDRWLKALWDNLGPINNAEDYSAVAISLPEKQKSTKTLIIAIVAALLLAAIIFFVLGFIKRASGDGPKPPAPPSQDQNIDYENAEKPVGPNGETPADPPKR